MNRDRRLFYFVLFWVLIVVPIAIIHDYYWITSPPSPASPPVPPRRPRRYPSFSPSEESLLTGYESAMNQTLDPDVVHRIRSLTRSRSPEVQLTLAEIIKMHGSGNLSPVRSSRTERSGPRGGVRRRPWYWTELDPRNIIDN